MSRLLHALQQLADRKTADSGAITLAPGEAEWLDVPESTAASEPDEAPAEGVVVEPQPEPRVEPPQAEHSAPPATRAEPVVVPEGADPDGGRRHYPALRASEAICHVRDQIAAQLVAKQAKLVALAHVDREGNDSAIVAELGRAFVGFVPGEVLLVDAKTQGSGWGGQLGCERGAGAEELFLGMKPLGEVVRPTTWAGLKAVPAGSHRHDIQLARSAEIEQVLLRCRESYGLVLLDLGFLDAAHVVPIARRCDATYLVVRLGETERQHARTALARLQYAGVPALGCLLSAAPAAAA